jgi:hypothetical protein
VISERIQSVAVGLLIALVAAAVVAMVLVDHPKTQVTHGKPRADLESASRAPIGILRYVAGPDGFVFRYQSGSCHEPGGPSFSLTDDDGWSFRPIRVPQVDDGSGIGASTPTITSVVSLDLQGRHRFVVAGTDDKCRLRTYTTTDAGTSWRQKPFKGGVWYVDPKTGVVYSPSGPANIDCPGISTLTSFDDESAVAYCTDGSVYQSDDGTTWDRTGKSDEVATSVFFDSPDDGYGVWPDGTCQSAVHRTTDGGSAWSKRGCVFPDALIPGIGGSDDLLMAGGNGAVWTSTNGGKTWARPKNPNDDSAIREQLNKDGGASPSSSASPTPSASPSASP